MSKITLSPNSSGTGTFTIASPNSNTDRTLTLPDEGGELVNLDSSGNLLVGTTDSSLYNQSTETGLVYEANAALTVARSGGDPLALNRLSSDGGMLLFQKNGTSVGSIGTKSGRLYIAADNGSNGGGLYYASSILPTDKAGTISDNTLDLGNASFRFDDIYATNSSIQTSDQNEKQQIASLTTAEMNAAKAISQLFKTFKWNDSVTANGDAARTHVGVIAQEVETAMTNAGLDAGDYAFFISSTWWEANGETYDTLAEAPAGATERTRKGIRYPELLSFVGAATEQRLADIETRLTALEAV